ncbi:hypothetical protein B0H14DRAFT_3436055 [Mycena olivaceomarginata]|nr:hypothetical protein B0H14DRAFT_3436055 [Mycena olivaceomarginata]
MLSSLVTDRARVTEIDSQILDLERSLSALRIEKSLARERLDSYKYPVLTLPNEIISEIFRAISVSILFQEQNYISDFLSRSGCCPLSIRNYGRNDFSVPEVFATVVSHRARWEHLHLYLSPSQLSIMDGPMPLLQHLHLTLAIDGRPTNIFRAGQMPLLRSVVLDGIAIRSADLPWAQLL